MTFLELFLYSWCTTCLFCFFSQRLITLLIKMFPVWLFLMIYSRWTPLFRCGRENARENPSRRMSVCYCFDTTSISRDDLTLPFRLVYSNSWHDLVTSYYCSPKTKNKRNLLLCGKFKKSADCDLSTSSIYNARKMAKLLVFWFLNFRLHCFLDFEVSFAEDRLLLRKHQVT